MKVLFRRCGATLLVLVAGLSMSLAYAVEIYQWTTADGQTVYTDKAPSATAATKLEIKASPRSASAVQDEPPPAAKAATVVIYTTSWCGVCKRAKAYFHAEGIPYQEYDIEKSRKGKSDYQRLEGKGVPIIMVNDKRLNGFSPRSFDVLYDS